MTEQETLKGQTKKSKAFLCMLKTNVHDHTIYKIRMNELQSLVEALGIEIAGELIQSRYRPFSKFLIGSGKVKELGKKVKRQGVDLVIFYNILRSSQKLNLIRALGCDVIDRYELTLEIFDSMASDTLSKLQIQAARLEKQAPFYKLQASINYRYDRPFFRAGGEYGFHGQMREMSRNRARVREEIDKLMEDKSKRIWNRRKLGYPVVCIAGFYNAGKTSLFNVVTGDNKPVSDRPFTTLTSKYQRRFIDHETTVLFIDTIGFVLDLDPRLIQSFKLNLLDIRSSDIVILLLEITDPPLTLQMKLDEGIRLLKEIGVSHDRIVVVFNKLDKDPELEKTIGVELNVDRYNLPWIAVSAKERKNLQGLLYLIAERLRHLRDNPPEPQDLSPFQRSETAINRLLQHYPVDYHPRDLDPFRGLVSTILSQNTNSKNQMTAYTRLEEMVGITPQRIIEASDDLISEAIKPAGMYNQRTRTLKAVSREVMERYGGDLGVVFEMSFPEARETLVELPGVGPKTADVALMFVADRQVVPVDRHVERVSKRLEAVPQNAGYEDVRRALEDASTPDRFREVHLSMIRFGREVCRSQKPLCGECLLNDLCPYPKKHVLPLSETEHSLH
ncbi:50S ribosome-binding GTPase [Candidatus Bathyarchaeota archaeon]|nr:50S ribosome-binding GTPase [Candidatus Bathyarchaeota archaeon]